MATKATEREEGEAAQEQQTDGPLLDLTDAAVKRMIKLAKKRGYVTYDELNEVLPSEEFTSEQIEDVLGQLSEMGINVIESEEADDGQAEPEAEAEEEAESGDLVEASTVRAVVVRETTKEPTDRTDTCAPTIRCACICARWARWSFSPVRAKSPSPSASRLAARP
jgi:RNA polymerase primary sigma factor